MGVAHHNISPPTIIGVIGDRPPPKKWLASLRRVVRRWKTNHVCLPFEVDARYLKNMVACLKLMDIDAVIIHGAHRLRLARLINKTNSPIDFVVRRSKKFVGVAVAPSSTPTPTQIARELFTHIR